MLDVLNRYAHGFVIVPVVLACRKGGVFEALEHGPHSAEELAEKLGANLGHLQVALRLLESLGWIDRRTDGRFEANASLANQRFVPDGLSALIQADMEAYFCEGTGGLLTPWVERVRSRWGLKNELLADFLDSMLVVPTLAHLTKRRILKDLPRKDFSDLPEGVREEVISLFKVLGWLEGSVGNYTLTAPGEFMFERAMNLGVSESYRPMLASIDQLLFGDAQRVFAHDAGGHETHVDRSMNVISSGFQHDRYFAEVDQILISIFSTEPFSAQPKFVADMGCGDGTFLKRVYQTIRDKTPRGELLSEYPLTLIGIDINEASLIETDRTLSGIDHVLIKGDIADPQKAAEDLKKLGADPSHVLHIRSFLDHDRPYIPPTDQTSLASRARARYLGAYSDREGKSISPAAAVQSLVENLRRWADVVSEHGLILLEVHCQDPLVVRAHIDQSESLYFDAIQGFSQQLLIEADVALLAAAEAGLFPARNHFRKFPRLLPYCRITLNRFERRPYCVRLARPSDLDALLRLEEACWPKDMRASREELQRRMDAYALGQLVIEMDDEIVGVIYSQRIKDVEQLRECQFRNLSGLADENGAVVQLLAVNVLPEKQHLGLGDQLLDLMLMRSELQGGVRQVAGITRCKNFRGSTLAELTDYIGLRNSRGRPVDPILQFHHSHGAKFLGPVPGYRPEDTDNVGAGVLLCYDFGATNTAGDAESKSAGAKSPVEPKVQLEACLRNILGPARQPAFSWKRPLREMGLDSLSLLEFRVLLEQTFGRPFSTTFFFSHPTLLDIKRHLEESLPESGPAASAADTDRVNLEDEAPNEDPERDAREMPANVATHPEFIAVIGMAGRFPECGDLEEYWDLLANGRDAVAEIPAERWNVDEFCGADPDAPGKIVSRSGGFLRNVDQFDAAFFNISPREAELMDPQQRLLLETHWEALENAGIDPNRLRGGACGIFVGLYSHDYELLQVAGGDEEDLDAYYATGNSASIASGRLAYFLGTRGPAITLDTACSSSLVAVHQAVRSLRSGECELAMASGVNLILSPRASIAFSKAGMLSPHGRCKTFDAAADGYVRSEGCGVVVLKRLNDAVRDGDVILAVIRGSAVNQDGASNGLTAPSVPAQEELIRGALKDARLRPADIDYLEAHGTGTQLGDPIEFQALQNVFRADPDRTEPLWIGSAKTNIGHTEAVAGIAGLIKVILSMQHQRLPAHLHFEKANPQIALDSVPARIPVHTETWGRTDRPLRAGISSFGFSGTNAHVILEQAPAPVATKSAGDRSAYLLPLSAKSGPALVSLVSQFAKWLLDHPELDLGDICHTASTGRAHHDFRIAFTSSTRDGLVHALRNASDRAGTVSRVKDAPKIAFLFTGQGSQYAGMARELSRTEPIFRKALRECREILADELEQPLEQILYPEAGQPSMLDETANTQPALFAVEYALARTLQSWGVEPDYVLGHSVGEYVAACIAGVFSLRDGLKLIAARGRLMQALPRDGAMIAILGRADIVEQAVQEAKSEVSVAAFNSPTNVVLSGRRAEVEAIGRRLEKIGAKVVPLQVSHAFHSGLMDPILPTFREVARMARFSTPKLNLVSNLTGDFARDEVTKADYWVRHIRQPVQFSESVRLLAQQGVNVMVEIGPHPVLLAMGQACVQHTDSGSIQWLRTLARGASDWDGTLASLGALYEMGVDIDWSRFNAGRKRSRVNLPTYPWQRKRFWLTQNSAVGSRQNRSARPEVPPDWFYEIEWISKPRGSEAETNDPADSFEQRTHAERGQPTTANGVPFSPMETGAVPPGLWFIFADRSGVSTLLARQLRALGDQTTQIPASDYDGTGVPGSEPSYARLLDRARQESQLPLRGVIHLGSLDAPEIGLSGPGVLKNAHRLGCESVLELAHAILRREWSNPPKIWVVTRGVQHVATSNIAPALAQAPVWGMGKVIALEHPEIWGGLIDLGADSDLVTTAVYVAREVHRPDGEMEIALHGEKRFVPRLHAFAPPVSRPSLFKADASYLITGGLGKIGLMLARWMVDHGARSLVLVGRTALPDRSTWAALPPGSSESEKVRTVQALERDGAQIHLHAADVSNAEAMASLFARFGHDLPPLKGLIHAAGIVEFGPIQKIDAAALERVFRPKVQGAWNLHELTRQLDLDFFTMFSSVSSVWGSSGLAAYAAANMFLDALSRVRRKAGLPAAAIDWGWWEGGATSGHDNEFFGKVGLQAMPATSALEALGRLLGSDRVQTTVASVNWAVFQPIYEAKRERPFLSELRLRAETKTEPTLSSDGMLLSRLLAADPERAKELLETFVQDQVAGVLHLDPSEPIDATSGFFKLGMDSIMTVELRGRLQKGLGRKLPATIAFEYPSIAALTDYVFGELGFASPLNLPSAAITQEPAIAASDSVSLDQLEDADLASILDEELTRVLNPSSRSGHDG